LKNIFSHLQQAEFSTLFQLNVSAGLGEKKGFAKHLALTAGLLD